MTAGIDGELIRKLRTAKSWSQEELGQISGLSARTVQRVETEGGGSLESRRALASAFGLKPEDLLASAPSGSAGDDAAIHVFQAPVGSGMKKLLMTNAVLSLIALLLTMIGLVIPGANVRNPIPIMLALNSLVVLGTTAFIAWVLGNTTYRLTAQGLQVSSGFHHRNYHWNEFAAARRLSGSLPLRYAFQPVTRLSDVVALERHAGGSAVALTPGDPEEFLRRISAFAPQLAVGRNS